MVPTICLALCALVLHAACSIVARKMQRLLQRLAQRTKHGIAARQNSQKHVLNNKTTLNLQIKFVKILQLAIAILQLVAFAIHTLTQPPNLPAAIAILILTLLLLHFRLHLHTMQIKCHYQLNTLKA